MHAIRLRGARTHNLKGVDVDLYAGELVVVTGVSGAGKSSLAFDTLYSEAQRRFVESFSPYARQFLERLERPPMTELDPVAAGVAVDRHAPIKSSRSTVATMADLEAYLAALFTCEAVPRCGDCGELAERVDAVGMAGRILDAHGGARAVLCYPLRVAGTEDYLGVRESLAKDGYRRLYLDGAPRDIDEVRPSEALATGGELAVLVERVRVSAPNLRRLAAALEEAWRRGEGRASLHLANGGATATTVPLVQGLSCPRCGKRFLPAQSGLFSYQSAVGACPDCRGFGRVLGIDWRKVVPDGSLSLRQRAIKPWSGPKTSWERRVLGKFCERHAIDMDKPWRELGDADKSRVIEGEGRWRGDRYPGVRTWFRWLESKSYKMHVRVLLSRYRSYDPCPACDGKRLSRTALGYEVDGLDLGDWHRLEIAQARLRLDGLDVRTGQANIAKSELVSRLAYLARVGLGYLTLDRQARTLSGGEAQRVSLTAALGTSLTGALFVLDEPTVGLHPCDVPPLVGAMRELADRGNAVVVVEHEPQVIVGADRVLELGTGAGRHGGALVFDGTPAEARRRSELATARALSPPRVAARRSSLFAQGLIASAAGGATISRQLVVKDAVAHNLAHATAVFPLGCVVAVCGPSGSGKSTLVDDVLYRALAGALGNTSVDAPGRHAAIEGADAIAAVSLVDQSPLGRTSRGNAATYTGAWSRIRALFAAQPEAHLAGLGPAHFSFNVAGGRCEACAGEGAETVEMQFLADVRLVCPACKGRRFRDEVLAVKLVGKSVADMLDTSVDDAFEELLGDLGIARALLPLRDLGLGYLPLGQPLSTLSGGEAQRLKLARAIADVGKGSLLILDEPSAGLHADEIDRLSHALGKLVQRGASVIVVDHDPLVIAAADWAIELGPGAGSAGGRVVAACTPAELRSLDTATGRALAREVAVTEVPRNKSGHHDGAIEIIGAREHNLKAVDVRIPRGKLVVVTGPSGSGKSSLAFDVVFAEAQRRFLETLTPYARQFLPVMPRPRMDRINGIPPSVALEQRTVRAGVSSTVATVTEIAHYLRLLYAKVGLAHCPDCDEPVRASSPDELFTRVRAEGRRISLREPVVRGRKGTYLDVFDAAERAGIEHALSDGARVRTAPPPRLAKTKEHDIDLIVYEGDAKSLNRAAFDRALAFGRGQLVVGSFRIERPDSARDRLLSSTRTCGRCGRSLPELDPRWFSFNTEQGRCAACDGTGHQGGERALERALQADDDDAPRLAPCRVCGGSRLAPVPRSVRLDGERYHEMVSRAVSSALARAGALRFEGDANRIAEAPLKELVRRLRFVDSVGLGYLGLDRPARTLSGGEMQRLRLAAQLGSGLTGALYVLDEPTIGLHPRDTARLLTNLRALVDTGSTVLVVEHDADTIRAADELIDLGPGGGSGGGRVMAQGPPDQVLADERSPTARALSLERSMWSLRKRSERAAGRIWLREARANNLVIDDLAIPAGCMVVVAGVSGSGKSTLVGEVLFPAIRRALGRKAGRPGAHRDLELPSTIERALAVDQSPIGRTSRSVPATFLGVWDPIRRVFAATPDARTRGYKASRFSFNSASAGGRCSACSGNGVIAHEMSFLPDVKTPCEACAGMRFEPSTLDVKYAGLSIGDVLRLTIDEASALFQSHRTIAAPLATLSDLGVGYVQLGQGSPTLSGGEAQRLKLAKELTAGRQHKPTLYVLDEPTTGLHHSDVGRLVDVLDRLVVRGDSLIIIEHHPAVIAAADHVIELGPEGGAQGGKVVAQGSPDEVARRATATGQVLARLLAQARNGQKVPLPSSI